MLVLLLSALLLNVLAYIVVLGAGREIGIEQSMVSLTEVPPVCADKTSCNIWSEGFEQVSSVK